MFTMNIRLLVPLIIMVLWQTNLVAQNTKRVFDWEKKEFADTGRLPFDEPFEILIDHTKPNDTFSVVIIDIDKKDPKLIYADTLKANGDKLNFVVDKRLPPNHSYKITISKNTDLVPLNTQQRKELYNNLISDKSFMAALKELFFLTPYPNLTIDTIDQLLDKNLKILKCVNCKLNDTEKSKGEFQAAAESIGVKVKNFMSKLQDVYSNASRCDSTANLSGLANENDSVDAEFAYRVSKDIKRYFEDVQKVKSAFGKKDKTSNDCVKELEFFLNSLNEIEPLNNSINSLIQNRLLDVIISSIISVQVSSSTNVDFNTEAALYTSQTFGYGYSPGTNNGLFYFAFTIYLRPVNNRVPLDKIPGFWHQLGARVGLNIGFTLEDVYSNNNKKIEGLKSIVFEERAGLVGLGVRILPFFKIDINALCYYAKDPNPLIDTKKFACSPFIGASISLNLAKLIAGKPNSLTSLQTALNQ